MNIKAFLSARSPNVQTLPIAILYVTEGCNLQCIMCSYREPREDELSLSEIESLATSLHRFGLRHIVFSGGEPLLRKDFPEICRIFSRFSVKQTLLTNGLLLHKRSEEFKNHFSEIIISLDGPDEETHNAIRGISAFSQIEKGIKFVRSQSPTQNISIRTVLQKKNFHRLGDMIQFAKGAGVNRISFLPADILSGSFGRLEEATIENQKEITLTESEIARLRHIINDITANYQADFASGFITESPEKLHRIAQYYQAILSAQPEPPRNCHSDAHVKIYQDGSGGISTPQGTEIPHPDKSGIRNDMDANSSVRLPGKTSFPSVLCNAPNVSIVIQSNGELLPCFFLPSFGNIRQTSFRESINSHSIKKTRADVKNFEVERCKTCVCSLYVSPARALFDSF